MNRGPPVDLECVFLLRLPGRDAGSHRAPTLASQRAPVTRSLEDEEIPFASKIPDHWNGLASKEVPILAPGRPPTAQCVLDNPVATVPRSRVGGDGVGVVGILPPFRGGRPQAYKRQGHHPGRAGGFADEVTEGRECGQLPRREEVANVVIP